MTMFTTDVLAILASVHSIVEVERIFKKNATKGFCDHLGCEHSPLAQVANVAIKANSIRVCKVIEATCAQKKFDSYSTEHVNCKYECRSHVIPLHG